MNKLNFFKTANPSGMAAIGSETGHIDIRIGLKIIGTIRFNDGAVSLGYDNLGLSVALRLKDPEKTWRWAFFKKRFPVDDTQACKAWVAECLVPKYKERIYIPEGDW